MKVWVDAQLSPTIARWLGEVFSIEAVHVRDLRLLHAKDREVFLAARAAGVVVMSKDTDFVRLLETLGQPPQVLWVTCGNTSNSRLHQVLLAAWPHAHRLLSSGEALVEISDRAT